MMKTLIHFFSSLRLTVVLLGLSMMLIFFGTLAQVLCLFIEVTDSISVCKGQFLHLDVTELLSINIVPDLCHIFPGKRDSHTLYSGHKVHLANLSLSAIVDESEHIGQAPMFVLHSCQNQTDQVFDVV